MWLPRRLSLGKNKHQEGALGAEESMNSEHSKCCGSVCGAGRQAGEELKPEARKIPGESWRRCRQRRSYKLRLAAAVALVGFLQHQQTLYAQVSQAALHSTHRQPSQARLWSAHPPPESPLGPRCWRSRNSTRRGLATSPQPRTLPSGPMGGAPRHRPCAGRSWSFDYPGNPIRHRSVKQLTKRLSLQTLKCPVWGARFQPAGKRGGNIMERSVKDNCQRERPRLGAWRKPALGDTVRLGETSWPFSHLGSWGRWHPNSTGCRSGRQSSHLQNPDSQPSPIYRECGSVHPEGCMLVEWCH